MKLFFALVIVALVSACSGGSHEPTQFNKGFNFVVSVDSPMT